MIFPSFLKTKLESALHLECRPLRTKKMENVFRGQCVWAERLAWQPAILHVHSNTSACGRAHGAVKRMNLCGECAFVNESWRRVLGDMRSVFVNHVNCCQLWLVEHYYLVFQFCSAYTTYNVVYMCSKFFRIYSYRIYNKKIFCRKLDITVLAGFSYHSKIPGAYITQLCWWHTSKSNSARVIYSSYIHEYFVQHFRNYCCGTHLLLYNIILSFWHTRSTHNWMIASANSTPTTECFRIELWETIGRMTVRNQIKNNKWNDPPLVWCNYNKS